MMVDHCHQLGKGKLSNNYYFEKEREREREEKEGREGGKGNFQSRLWDFL
jgi:hypothetical protein